MSDIQAGLSQSGLDLGEVRERVYRAATPRERERWHALWLLAQGLSANNVAAVLDRDAHTIGGWLTAFCAHGPTALAFEQIGGSPAFDTDAQADLKVAVQATPAEVGIALANRGAPWAVEGGPAVLATRCRLRLSRATCLRYLQRLGFVYKRRRSG